MCLDDVLAGICIAVNSETSKRSNGSQLIENSVPAKQEELQAANALVVEISIIPIGKNSDASIAPSAAYAKMKNSFLQNIVHQVEKQSTAGFLFEA